MSMFQRKTTVTYLPQAAALPSPIEATKKVDQERPKIPERRIYLDVWTTHDDHRRHVAITSKEALHLTAEQEKAFVDAKEAFAIVIASFLPEDADLLMEISR